MPSKKRSKAAIIIENCPAKIIGMKLIVYTDSAIRMAAIVKGIGRNKSKSSSIQQKFFIDAKFI